MSIHLTLQVMSTITAVLRDLKRKNSGKSVGSQVKFLAGNEDEDEILDEAMGLIRTAQQFQDSKRVMKKWELVKSDIFKVFSKKKTFIKTFKKWHHKKICKNQAIGVKPEHLIDFAGSTY